MSTILQTHDLVKQFGGLTATDHVSLSLLPGEVHAIIGPNGAGKTTLISQLVGEQAPTSGRVEFLGRDVTALGVHQRALLGLARSYQITQICRDFTALENVMLSVQAQGHSGNRPGNFRFWKPAHREVEVVEAATQALTTVGLAARAHTEAAVMAHGEHRQLELAMALATRPKLLLLDEPLAGMSHAEGEAMVRLLQSLKTTYPMLLVEHDMDAVFALADRISVLVYGRIIATGKPEDIKSHPDVKKAYLGEESA